MGSGEHGPNCKNHNCKSHGNKAGMPPGMNSMQPPQMPSMMPSLSQVGSIANVLIQTPGVLNSLKKPILITLGILILIFFLFRSESNPYHPLYYNANKAFDTALELDKCISDFDPDKAEIVSWYPRVFVYDNFLTDEEADYIIAKGNVTGLSRSLVAAGKGDNNMSNSRTSFGTFLRSDFDPILQGIEDRISSWIQIPPSYGENFYLLRYKIGQEYKAHHDYFHEEVPGMEKYLGTSGQRTATILMYLENTEEGGETLFPVLDVAVAPKKGRAVLFFSHTPDAYLDPTSLHASLPVSKGIKYCCTKWVRLGNYHTRIGPISDL
eukprot:TRINITY_DN1228_c0_g1_i2.p1 TRINITY_DN1228_c0_g1~~TRINITY_DN1228_c0_g1_i2.p1  ORF type:complete len:323 (-),score=99.75 TRINITY_DN1228_c0_g1_i2:130-1098(-)